MRFVEVTDVDNVKWIINLNQIVSIKKSKDEDCCVTMTTGQEIKLDSHSAYHLDVTISRASAE